MRKHVTTKVKISEEMARVAKFPFKYWYIYSWTAPDLPVFAVRCYPTLLPRHLQVLKHIWGDTWLHNTHGTIPFSLPVTLS